MTFTTETSRSEALNPLQKAQSVFAQRLHGYSDAVFFSLDKTHVFAVTGMPIRMPAGRKLLADPEIGIYLKGLSSDVLYAHYCLSPASRTSIMYMSVCLRVYHEFLRLCLLFLFHNKYWKIVKNHQKGGLYITL